MRLNNLIPTFLLSLPLFCSPVDARRRHKGTSLAQHEREVFTQRQYRPQNLSSRDLIDICINLDAVVDGNPLLEGELTHDLDIFLDTYVDLDLLGLRTLVEAELRTFCSSTLNHPANQFQLTRTVLAPLRILARALCNGVCGYFPHGCGGRPSALPRSVKKRVNQKITFADAQAYCGDKSVCGVPGGSEHAFECLDTKSNPESCGGCLYAHPWSQTNAFVAGTDCSTVSSPQAVSHRCENGYIRGPGGCVPSSRIVPRMAFGGPGAASSPSSRSTSANDIIADLTPLANAGVNLGPGLNNAVTGLSEGLGPTPSSGSGSGSSSCPSGSQSGTSSSSGSGSASGSDIIADLSPLAKAGVNLGPGLNSAVTGLSAGLGLGKVIYPGQLVSGKREEDCDGDGSSGSTIPATSPSPTPTQPAPPSKSEEPCPDDSGSASSTGDGNGNDIVADLSPLAKAGVNLGPGLNSAVTGLSEGLGLGKVIYPGKLVNDKREEDCDCEDGDGSSTPPPPTQPTRPPTPSSTSTSLPPHGSGSGSSSACPSGSGTASSSSGSSSSSGNDIVADLSPLTKANVNLGSGLNSAVTGTAGGLGLGEVIYPGELVNEKREEAKSSSGSGSSSSSGIVTDLSPLTKVGVDLGPGLDSAVTGLAGGLGLGKVIYSGGLVNA
ncbi:hypothetical protein F5880DRAFT_1505876 [Lentinula raphanica]|nr:hypothetical protein F5880DRAFT_1505876 [Lentinula raphanica]